MKLDDYLTIKSLNYPVYIGQNIRGPVDNIIRPYAEKENAFILSDHNTEKYCLPLFFQNYPESLTFPHFSVESGEGSKDLAIVEKIWTWLMNEGADRNSLLINLGGGVISDLGGFAAGTYKRGIKFINIPTSLIGQADAAIGGKTGINFSGIKNHAGLFANPLAVFIDPKFLDTLPEDHIRSGYAEIIKCALLAGNGFWNEVRNAKLNDAKTLEGLIIESVKFKSDVVARDHFDHSFRRILNFGHTVGHALESYFNKPGRKGILHGDAISAGMICSAYLSTENAGLTQHKRDEIVTFIKERFPVKDYVNYDIEEILVYLEQDKKKMGERMNFSLLKAIGEPVFDLYIEREQVIESLDYLKKTCRL